MHPNPVFHTADTAENLAFARDRAFGVLAVTGEAEPLLSHVPFLLSGDGAVADLHLVRSNPIVRALAAPRPARQAAAEQVESYGMGTEIATLAALMRGA